MLKDWKKIVDKGVQVKFKNTKTKEIIIGVKDKMTFGGWHWVPVHGGHRPDAYHLIAGLSCMPTKESIILELKKYMRNN